MGAAVANKVAMDSTGASPTLSFVATCSGVGLVALPWAFWNGVGVAVGAYYDAKRLFKKAAGTTLAQNAGNRLKEFANTPIRDTLRLKPSDPRNQR